MRKFGAFLLRHNSIFCGMLVTLDNMCRAGGGGRLEVWCWTKWVPEFGRRPFLDGRAADSEWTHSHGTKFQLSYES